MYLLQQIPHNSTCYDGNLGVSASPQHFLKDLPNEATTISRIHVIDAEFQAGVKCTFKGEYMDDIDFKDVTIESSCIIRGEVIFA